MRMVRICKFFPRTLNTVLWRIFPLQRLDFGLEFWAYGHIMGRLPGFFWDASQNSCCSHSSNTLLMSQDAGSVIMNKAKVIFKMIVVRHYLLVSFVICFVILLPFGDDFFAMRNIFYHFFSFQGFSCFFSRLHHHSHAGSRGVPVHLSGERFL